jgi:hypothetical protein
MSRVLCVVAMLGSRIAVAAPMRPLPAATSRVLEPGPRHDVDPMRGNDASSGDAAHPWKTIAHGVASLKPGDVLVLHGGVYYETVSISISGTDTKPIIIRSAPGELAIVDGGIREFAEAPAKAWEPVAGGEYRSTASYPDLRIDDERGVPVTGNFADTMVPLHGYRFSEDLRATNQYWNVPKAEPGKGIYVGPGVWLERSTHRIHVRLAPTTLASQGDANYRGETDPRKLALVVAPDRSPLRLQRASHVRIEDIVVRGSAGATIDIDGCDHVDLVHLAIFGGAPALRVKSTSFFTLQRSTVRGLAAPWSSRASMKYRGNSPYLFVADSKGPRSHDWEIAFDEFTDSHDGLVIDSIKTLRFHHNRIDNINDDGLYLTVPPRDSVPDDIQIYQNYITRVLTTLAFADSGLKTPNAIGSGVYVFRNVFDLRDGTYGWPAKDAAVDAQPLATQPSRMCGDHGSPIWDPVMFYNNTVITAGNAFRNYYGEAMVMGTTKTKRRVFDNIFIQVDGAPGFVFPNPSDDVVFDGNVMWGIKEGAAAATSFATGKHGPHDVYGDPKLARIGAGLADVRPTGGSAAIDAGVAVPASWPDPLRRADAGKPDAGALPAGATMFHVGPDAQ